MDCEARGLTRHTIETYKSNVKDFLEAVPEPASVTLEVMRRYLRGLRARDLQGGTLKGHFSAISTFYEYLIFEGMTNNNPVLPFRRRYLARIKPVAGGENTRQLISVQDMRLVILATRSILDITILVILAKTGMRRGELLDMTIDSICLEKRIIRIPAKAKRSQRTAFIDDELYGILIKYLKWRCRRGLSSWLWINKEGNKMGRDYPGEVIGHIGKSLGLHDPKGPLCSRLTPHCFRHWFTTHLFRAGMDPQYIMWLRGDSMGRQAWQLVLSGLRGIEKVSEIG